MQVAASHAASWGRVASCTHDITRFAGIHFSGTPRRLNADTIRGRKSGSRFFLVTASTTRQIATTAKPATVCKGKGYRSTTSSHLCHNHAFHTGHRSTIRRIADLHYPSASSRSNERQQKLTGAASFTRSDCAGIRALSSHTTSSRPPDTKTMSSTSEQRLSKRKQPSVPSSNDRPMKQFKQHSSEYANGGENGSAYAGSSSPEITRGDSTNDIPLDIEEPRQLSRVNTTADTAEWQATVEKVIKNVVSIHFCQTHSFDTESALASEATGFVVDAERGYILTNRHVVGPGPFWGYCIFDNHEECDVYPIYRDPVHDFGILRFDPKKIKYMPVTALKLRPDLAKVGVEIRVVGNDAGEKLSILSGVISRLDRNAPEYGDGYCDFNTNYIQAAAAASGGSSGSPVVNVDGYAVALQAGGRSDGASTDYFLPLDRPLRALQCIQQGTEITRGTIQTQWLLKPYDECRRLGLTANWEAEMRARFPSETGVLVAEVILPKGPAHEKLEEGDVLLKVNGELVSQFIRLDDILDSSVGKKVHLLVQRGGRDIEVEVGVEDLHAITPDRFVTVVGATFHDLSYQQARLYAISVKGNGVYVCEAAGTFRLEGSESGWLVQQVDNKDTPDLETFIKVMSEIPDRSRIVISYKHLRDLHTKNTAIINVDRHWHKKMRLAVRNDKTGLWDFSDLADGLPPVQNSPQRAKFIQMPNEKYPQAVEILRSFVRVTCILPIKIDGFPRGRKVGHGLVVDAEKGLVVVSRAVVPYDMCDIHITIADSIQVPGKVLFMHPLQNFCVIQYDASLVQAPIQSAKLSKSYIKQGQEVIFFGFNHNYRPITARTTVTDITTVAIPASPATPRYRAINIDAVTVDTNLAGQCGSGVLISEDGTVQALWLTYLGDRSGHSGKDAEYHLGLMAPIVQPVIDSIQAGVVPDLRILSAELHTCPMDHCRIMGVPEEWIERVEREDPERHQLFMARKIDSGNDNGGLQESDLILTLNGKLITRVSDLDIQYNHTELDATIVRKRQVMNVKVTTTPTSNIDTSRVAVFCGALLHRPHHAVRQQISKIHSDVYVSGRTRGSPAYMYGLAPTNFITHVNGVSTPELEVFLNEVQKIPDNTYFRLKVITFDNVPWVATMKKCEHYFPTVDMHKDPSEPTGWKTIVREAERGGETEGMSAEVDIDGAGQSTEIPDADVKCKL